MGNLLTRMTRNCNVLFRNMKAAARECLLRYEYFPVSWVRIDYCTSLSTLSEINKSTYRTKDSDNLALRKTYSTSHITMD